ncbi:MAG: family 78 glycoside hydrolase catalytic domain, partial [Lachnospiraceae bacterium]
ALEQSTKKCYDVVKLIRIYPTGYRSLLTLRLVQKSGAGHFQISKKIKSAYVFTTALGLYQFYMNGEKVGDDEMMPGWTSYRRHLLYQTYDVSDLLCQGVNIAAAILGAGWYKGMMGVPKKRCHYGNKTGFAMHLVVHYEDGSQESYLTGTHWSGADAPIVFSEIYDGEIYDAALEIPEWNREITPGKNWHKTIEIPFDNSVLSAQSGARVKEQERFGAQQILVTPKGETVLDFGQNMAGRIHVNAMGKAGDRIELRCFETLDHDGNVYLENLRTAKAAMKYIFASDGTISYHPFFTYMGFRYAVIVSYPGEIRRENFTACALHSDMERTGEFCCSEALLNQLHHNFLWSMKGNFLDVPTDCPQRDERLGWTGDVQIFSRTACYLMNANTFYKKWLRDVEADQTAEGGVPHVIPNIEEGREAEDWLFGQGSHSAAGWADAAVIVPWTLYQMYADKMVLETQYISMKRWIDFMKTHAVDYIWNYKLQFGDWLALDAEPGSYFGATPNELTCTSYFAYSTRLFVKIAAVLGKKEDVLHYERLYQKIVEKFQKTFFDTAGNMTVQTQTAHILALYFQLTPAAYIAQTVATLKELLAKEDGHLVTGFVGTPYFCHALSQNGCVAEAYELLLKEDFPSWLYQIKKGATTIWEHWDGLKPDGSMWSPAMNSFNHYAYGAIGEWMYRVMVGIDTDENKSGFKHAILYPRIGGGLKYVAGSYHSIYGEVCVRWEIEENRVTMITSIPANTTASIRLDQAKNIVESDGLTFEERSGYWEAHSGSGVYEIIFER